MASLPSSLFASSFFANRLFAMHNKLQSVFDDKSHSEILRLWLETLAWERGDAGGDGKKTSGQLELSGSVSATCTLSTQEGLKRVLAQLDPSAGESDLKAYVRELRASEHEHLSSGATNKTAQPSESDKLPPSEDEKTNPSCVSIHFCAFCDWFDESLRRDSLLMDRNPTLAARLQAQALRDDIQTQARAAVHELQTNALPKVQQVWGEFSRFVTNSSRAQQGQDGRDDEKRQHASDADAEAFVVRGPVWCRQIWHSGARIDWEGIYTDAYRFYVVYACEKQVIDLERASAET